VDVIDLARAVEQRVDQRQPKLWMRLYQKCRQFSRFGAAMTAVYSGNVPQWRRRIEGRLSGAGWRSIDAPTPKSRRVRVPFVTYQPRPPALSLKSSRVRKERLKKALHFFLDGLFSFSFARVR
jgi:hypothetical protein